MAVMAGYKQTEVGVIPVDWKVLKLTEICSMKSGEGITSANIDKFSKYPCYGGNGLRGYTTGFTHNGRYALIGRQGALCGNVVGADGKFFASEHAIVVTPLDQTDIRWLTFVLGRMRLNQYSESSAQPGLSVSKLLCLHEAIPPTKAEQQAIAAALSDADALIEALEQLIAKKRHLKQGTMQELLTGKKRLPGFSGEWEVKRLGELATFHKGKGLPKSALVAEGKEPCIHYGELFTRYSETIIEIISYTNTSEGTFRSIANDVLMPTSDVTPRGLAKASCVRTDGVILGGDILVIRSDTKLIFGSFLSYLIRYEEKQVLQLVTGSTVFHLYGTDMKKFTFCMPSLPEQIAIATILSDMDTEIAALESKLAKTRALKQGMMHNLLTGKVRLV